MIKVKKEGVLLRKTTLSYKNGSVLNSAAIREGERIKMFYKADRKANYLSVRYCKFKDPLTVKIGFGLPVLSRHLDYESHGFEGSHYTKTDNLYYLTCTVCEGTNALGVLAV